MIRIPETYYYMPIAFGLPKNSPFKELINHFVTRMKERGVYDKIVNTWMLDHPHCNVNQGKGLGWKNLILVLVVFGIGFGFSLIFFVLEFIWKHYTKTIFLINIDTYL